MNKKFLSIASLALCGAMIFGAGCTPDSGIDTETRRLKLAVSSLEGNFNPFFYTAANDGEIASMTQLPLMTIDGNGDLAYGQNEACVALDYQAKTYDANGNETLDGDMNGTTEYQIIIKKGIKFSDGVDLTIKDVLFNFYVYLDPAYTGSSTIYSTDIKGLNAYRSQNADMLDGVDLDLDRQFTNAAQVRIQALIDWSQRVTSTVDEEDLEVVETRFLEEATNDWNTYEIGWVDTFGEDSMYNFDAAWQAYLFAEGLITVQTRLNSNGVYEQVKNEDGTKYLTTLDPYVSGVDQGQIGAQQFIDDIAAATTEAKISAYMNEHSTTRENAILQLQKEYCVNAVYTNYTDRSNIAQVLSYWATASTVLSDFTAQERTLYYDELRENNGGKPIVSSISGITTKKTSTDFKGNNLGSEYDVLNIVINGVDPKAVWNFCFSIAPLHYYSGTYQGVNYVSSFNGVDNFGVLTGSGKFYTEVVRATEKNGLPVGAGSYMASNVNGNATNSRSEFFSNYVVYFMRNDQFTTVGTGIDNAKIKYLSYQVMSDANIVDALRTEQIDFGEPNATSQNQTEINGIGHLGYETYLAGGYGYVGINPKFVPDVTVRQAIMKSLDASLTVAYYGRSLATQIYRPMSTTSWVYQYEGERLRQEYDAVKYTSNDEEITSMLEAAGYYRPNGTGTYTNGTHTLKYTFTIAGESSDHPAYDMFTQTSDRLNELGFDITVQTELTALSKLNTGSLAVWAAAWSTSIDPDMYQVYHKDSMATSVNNWNYPEIKYNTSGNWGYEQGIVNELSAKIDAGRETLSRATRSSIYADCLDYVMDLAVEFPTYQRNTISVYNKNVIDRASLTSKPSANLGLFGKIWEVDYIK